jgi:AAA domain
MAIERGVIRVNPGGGLDPSQVWDRDDKIAEIWRTLDRPQSVYLTGERRSGKTSTLQKMKADLPDRVAMVYTDVEDVNTPGEFANKLFVKVSEELPALAKARGWLVKKLKDLGITKVSAGGIGIEFAEVKERQWSALISQIVEALERLDDQRTVLVFDELPQMLTNIAKRGQPLDARQILDTLRELRQTRKNVRMIFTGSIGLHHVLSDLAEAGGSWAPINDMAVIDVPPLAMADAVGLAHELIVNEHIATADVEQLAQAIADAVDCAPFYIHQVIASLTNRPASAEPASPSVVEAIVVEKLNDPQDPWKFTHFVTRVPLYYGPDAELATAILDIVAVQGAIPFQELRKLLPAHLPFTTQQAGRLTEILDLLQNDYYLFKTPAQELRFRQALLARAWRARRYL